MTYIFLVICPGNKRRFIRGMTAKPTIARAIKVVMMVKEEKGFL
jgi:hypothetical protein